MSIEGTFVINTSGAVQTAVTEVTPGTAASNLGKAEDAAHTSGDVGVMALAVRNDGGASLVGTDGDYIPLTTDSSGALRVTGGSAGTQYTEGDTDASITGTALMMEGAGDTLVAAPGTAADGLLVNLGANNDVTVTGDALTALQLIDDVVFAEDAAHVSGDKGVMGLSVRKDTAAALAGTDGDYQPLVTDASGRLHVNVGNSITVGSHDVTNAGTFAVQVTGDALTALQLIDNLVLAEDAAHVSADPGVQALAVRKATPANLSGTDGDYEPLQISAGRLWTSATIDAALPAGSNAIGKLTANSGVDIGDVDVTSIVPGTGATNLGKAEDAVHASGDVGVMALAVRKDTATALAGADGDYSPLLTDATGYLRVSIMDAQVSTPGNGVSTAKGLATYNQNLLYNGSTWDQAYSYYEGTALSSAARTATTNSSDINTLGAKAVYVWLNITSAGTGNLRIFGYNKDPVSSNYSACMNGAQNITTTGFYGFAFGLGVPAGAFAVGSGSLINTSGCPLSATLRITAVHSDASSWTYSVGYCLVY